MWKWVTYFSLGNLSHTDEVANQWPCCWWDHFSQNAVQRVCRGKCESEPMFTSYLFHTNKWNQSINHPRVNMALSILDYEWELINFPVCVCETDTICVFRCACMCVYIWLLCLSPHVYVYVRMKLCDFFLASVLEVNTITCHVHVFAFILKQQ